MDVKRRIATCASDMDLLHPLQMGTGAARAALYKPERSFSLFAFFCKWIRVLLWAALLGKFRPKSRDTGKLDGVEQRAQERTFNCVSIATSMPASLHHTHTRAQPHTHTHTHTHMQSRRCTT
eukprot:1159228-Pelagomonas_calceolata.AAC.7